MSTPCFLFVVMFPIFILLWLVFCNGAYPWVQVEIASVASQRFQLHGLMSTTHRMQADAASRSSSTGNCIGGLIGAVEASRNTAWISSSSVATYDNGVAVRKKADSSFFILVGRCYPFRNSGSALAKRRIASRDGL